MCTRHPNLVSSAFYAIPIFHIIIGRIFNLLVNIGIVYKADWDHKACHDAPPNEEGDIAHGT